MSSHENHIDGQGINKAQATQPCSALLNTTCPVPEHKPEFLQMRSLQQSSKLYPALLVEHDDDLQF